MFSIAGCLFVSLPFLFKVTFPTMSAAPKTAAPKTDKKVEVEKIEKKADEVQRPKNHVRVSGTKSHVLYADVTKHLLHDGEKEVVLTALNSSISDAVAVAEMLKNFKLANVKKITTSRGQEETARRLTADKIEIIVTKAANFDKIYAEHEKERANKKAELEKAKK